MALRVLLADESLNVKKNMQLFLQDYGVEVKTVLSGEEVGTSTRTFKPDIIFLDILLAKINGYDACSQLKNHPDYRHIPVILTWSSFMEIDETKFKLSRADSRLEKPFDKESLRKLIQHFVPKVKSQGLSEFLSFPDPRPLDTNEESDNLYSKTLTHFTPRSAALSELGIDDEPDEFQHATLSAVPSTTPEISPLTTNNDEADEWSPQRPSPTKSTMKQPLPPPTMEESFEVEIASIQLPEHLPPPPPSTPDLDLLNPSTKIAPSRAMPSRSATPSQSLTKSATPPPSLDAHEIKKMIQTELRPMIEETLNKILPEIAERIIREEIQKLMNETEKELE